MTRKPFAVLGLSAAAAVGGALLSQGVASATPAPPRAIHAPYPATSATVAPTTAAPVAVAPVAPAAAPARPTSYVVVPGDTLWSIGQRYGVTMEALAASNGMEQSEVLFAGKTLTLPAPGAPVVASTSTATTASSSTTDHASTATAAPAASSSLEQCVISRESGGNSQVTNGGGYWGLFQFSRSTWAAYGGSPSEFGQASSATQEQVFNNAIARGGSSNWTSYDGC